MSDIRKTARLAGLLYLPVVIADPFVMLYVPGRLFVPGDASATAANILAHQALFRTAIVAGMVTQLIFLAAVLTLHQLLEGTGRRLARAMVLLTLLVAPLAMAGSAIDVATLRLLGDPQFLATFAGGQREALVMMLLQFDRSGVLVSELYWGLWLLPLGILVHRSRFLPRLLGAWLFANGVAYVVLSLTGILWPHLHATVFKFATPFMLGEAVLAVWLVTMGARVRGGGAGAAGRAGV